MVIAARASAFVTPWSGPSTLAAPAAASSRVSRSGYRRAHQNMSCRFATNYQKTTTPTKTMIYPVGQRRTCL